MMINEPILEWRADFKFYCLLIILMWVKIQSNDWTLIKYLIKWAGIFHSMFGNESVL